MRVVIVGGGVAGVSAARALVDGAGPDQDIQPEICTEEPVHYYYRPKLPDYLGGVLGLDDIVAYGPGWYQERGILYRTGVRVAALDFTRGEVLLENAPAVSYDRLVLATGGRSFVPPIPGAQVPGVFTLRSVGDADAMGDYVRRVGARTAIVIGGGLLGLESASALVRRGLSVTVLEVADWLLPRQLDKQGAELLQSRLESRGLRVRVGIAVSSVVGDDRVRAVAFSSKAAGMAEELAADLVLVSAGVAPETSLAVSAGLSVGRGIVVDDHLRTSMPGVYAIGDAAEHRGRAYGMAPSAIDQARAAAAHILRGDAAVPYLGTVAQTTLKVAGLDLTALGDTSGGQEVRMHLSPDGHVYKKLFLSGGVLLGAILMGTRSGRGAISEAISTKAAVSDEQISSFLEP